MVVTGWALVWLVALGTGSFSDEPPHAVAPPAVVIRAVHPDQQAAAIMKLFEGSPAPHPAAALAAWKRASRESGWPGKPVEAVIAFFNPDMVAEWRTFHEASVKVGFSSERPGVRWRIDVPRDDGTVSALITAMRLSGGGLLEPASDRTPAVERLGTGSIVATRQGRGVAIAGSREELESWTALEEPVISKRAEGDPDASGFHFQVRPERLQAPADATVSLRRAIALARHLGREQIVGRFAVEVDQLRLEVISRLKTFPDTLKRVEVESVDPRWLSWIPMSSVAAFTIAIGDSPSERDRLFFLADQVDRADPARSNLAPLRTRLNLLAFSLGARLEADLWPHLRGVTLGMPNEPARGKWGSMIGCLHMDSDKSAARVLNEVLPRLTKLPGAANQAGQAEGQTGTQRLGQVGGRPLEAMVRGSTIVIGWGDGALAAAIQAASAPPNSMQGLIPPLPSDAGQARLSRIGLLRPGRLSLPIQGFDQSSSLATSLTDGPPITWSGWLSGDQARDVIQWPGLRGQVRRFLASIPLEMREAPATAK